MNAISERTAQSTPSLHRALSSNDTTTDYKASELDGVKHDNTDENGAASLHSDSLHSDNLLGSGRLKGFSLNIGATPEPASVSPAPTAIRPSEFQLDDDKVAVNGITLENIRDDVASDPEEEEDVEQAEPLGQKPLAARTWKKRKRTSFKRCRSRAAERKEKTLCCPSTA